MSFFTRLDRFQEVCNLVHKRVLITNLKPRHPPFVHVGMLSTMVGHVDRPPSAKFAFVTVIEVLETMKIMMNQACLALSAKLLHMMWTSKHKS